MFTGILPHNSHFYPRSPCGERPRTGSTCGGGQNISIHALLAESDSLTLIIGFLVGVFLSTLSLRRATWPGLLARPFFIISIHALLAESDLNLPSKPIERNISIHALLAESDLLLGSLICPPHDFYPRSPCGERLSMAAVCKALSAISIHALLAESDGFGLARLASGAYFYPRSPCGERPRVS